MNRHQSRSHDRETPDMDDVTRRDYGGKGGQASDLAQADREDFPGIDDPTGQVREDEGLFEREPGPERVRVTSIAD